MEFEIRKKEKYKRAEEFAKKIKKVHKETEKESGGNKKIC